MSQYENIYIENEEKTGSVEGYTVQSEAEQLANWVRTIGCSEMCVSDVKKKFKKIAILKSMFVEEEERNQGIGSELLEGFVNEATFNGSEAILLEADTGEENEINLIKWYESFGFKIIDRKTGNYPLMMLVIE